MGRFIQDSGRKVCNMGKDKLELILNMHLFIKDLFLIGVVKLDHLWKYLRKNLRETE